MIRSLPWQHRLLLLAWFLSLNISAFAQKKRPLPGYVVTTSGDTLLGVIFPTTRMTQQYQVEFIPLQGTHRLTLSGYQLISYTYYKDLDTVRYVSLAFGSSKPRRGFLQQVAAGKAQLYYYNSAYEVLSLKPISNDGYRSYFYYDVAQKDIKYPFFAPSIRRGLCRNPERSYVIYQEKPHLLTHVNSWKFPQDAIIYFGGYPELVADLKTGRYRFRDIPKIVRRYNAWHLAQQTMP